MTRKTQDASLEDGKSRKRVLKPVVEKKRRDRINQSLAELRNLLLNHTSDARLQNPKIEKAEILDLTVEYLQKWTDGKKPSSDLPNSLMKAPAPVALNLHRPDSSAPSLMTVENAGFQQCVTQLTNYMHRLTPSQKSNLIEGLRHHTEPHSKPDFTQRGMETDPATRLHPASLEYTSEHREESHRLLVPSHSPFQPHSCSTPTHDYLSPLPPPGSLPPSPHTPPLLLSRPSPLTSPSPPACHLWPPTPPSSASHPPSLTRDLPPCTASPSPRSDVLLTQHRGRGHQQTPPHPCGDPGSDDD